MGDKTQIEWTDATWNPVTGCTKVSLGCKNCYMFREYPKLAKGGVPGYAGGTPDLVRLWPARLDQPLHWREPRRIFVCSMADLFHRAVTVSFIHEAFMVMVKAKYHTFQVLTKRPEIMLEYVLAEGREHQWPDGISPPSNIWLGVSVEDQKTAEERIPLLLQTPAAVRFVSYEPALGPLDLSTWLHVMWGPGKKHWFKTPMFNGTDERGMEAPMRYLGKAKSELDWIIAGGESGPHARPSHPDWFRSVRDQCHAAGVPFFFKQWGEWLPHDQDTLATTPILDQAEPMQWLRYGKKAAGRLLDSREWSEFPELKENKLDLHG